MFIVQVKAKQLQQLTLLAPSVVYDEEKQIVYLGYDSREVKGYLSSLETLYRCEEIEVRAPKYTDGDLEIVIRDLPENCPNKVKI
ncbi:MAG: hypothetical protein QNJ54_36510 [Prochloraceae cyanobacterium]|nr:hypothetical protein [Prochloraceae cyanobacterium]